MKTDVERIAEVVAAHDWINPMTLDCECGERVLPSVADGVRIPELRATHQAEQLTAAGMGHVPTALHQAADEADAHAVNCPEGCDTPSCAQNNRTTAHWLRARADRAGGNDE